MSESSASRKRHGFSVKNMWSVSVRTAKNEIIAIGKGFAFLWHIVADRFVYYFSRNKKNIKKPEPIFFRGQTNLTFLLSVIALLAFGLVMLFSASYVESFAEHSGEGGLGGYHVFVEQLKIAIPGLLVMMLASHVRIDVYRKLAGVLYVASLVLMVYVLINPDIKDGKEHIKRWISIFGISIQPSEIAKLSLIVYMSYIMEKYQKYIQKSSWAIIPNAVPLLIVLALMIPESHNSGLIIIFAIGVAMLFFGGIKMRWFVLGGALAIVGIIAVWIYGNHLVEQIELGSYSQSRISVWIKLLTNHELTRDERLGEAWQSLQSLYAIGSGGLFGLGFGQSKQKHMYLPEPQNDFIFAIVCEELGFFRAVIIMAAFVLLVGMGMYIACQAKSKFAAMMAMGLTFKVGLQALLNFGVVTSTIPNTGISLPFFSSGGTALLLQLFEMGIILAVARESRKKGSYALQ